ncbi:MAG TPA: sigma-54-dependent Fis family transcriptional regulator, partial [Steroidobacteraceae bacterium]|nr:sigma-54-dependent Fis family transcriptional regulator [Steroidobacteraceae bacterium]
MADPTVVRHADRVLRVAHGMAPEGVTALSEPIGDSWRRCVRDYSLDPVRTYSPAVISTGDLRGRQVQHEQLIQIASAEMDSLYDQIAGSGYALMLTDASGVILCEKIDATLKSLFRSAGLLVGADWSELHEGTNGIGTCISVDRPVTVHRTEHFRARHIGLSCSGAPIHEPSGSLLAVLDASTVDARDTRASQAHTMALVNMSAQLIEKCIFLQHHHKANIVRFHARPELVNLLHDGSLALAMDGTVIAADAMAVRLLAARGRHDLVGRTFDEIFDVRIEDLLAPASLARQALWPVRDASLGRRYFASLHIGGSPQSHPQAVQTSAGSAPGFASTRTDSTRVTPVRATAAQPRPASASIGTTPPPPATAKLDARSASAARTNRVLTFDELAGNDANMANLVRKASRVADSTLPVLIQGPTGSGKECFARALHTASPRASHPFVAVNCAALPETLIESELFGYGPGAFTGAKKEGRKGKIVQSSGGTLFLDEIGDMPLLLQTRLLRVLEEQEVIPLGAEAGIPVDLRVVCASNQDLRELLAAGEFREDLYYRLNGIMLELPALAARTDKEVLIRRFLAEESGMADAESIDAAALERLTKHVWPGNIRELRNVIRSAFAICDHKVIRLCDLPAQLGLEGRFGASTAGSGHITPPSDPLAHAERETLLSAIRASRGNLCNTAKQLGISRNSLYRKLKRHGIAV